MNVAWVLSIQFYRLPESGFLMETKVKKIADHEADPLRSLTLISHPAAKAVAVRNDERAALPH